jgi:hypothetical protein
VRWRTAAVAAAVVAAGMALTPLSGHASSHREAPLISADPQVDNTDVYAFVSPDKPDTVTIIANWYGFEEPNGGPNFYPWAPGAHYDINIDNVGDAKAHLTYRWTFASHYRTANTFLYNTGPVDSLDSPNLNFTQTYNLDLIDGTGKTSTLITNGKVAPSLTGMASMPNYRALRDQAITPLPNGGSSFAGQAADPFFVDLRVFDLLYGTNLKEVGTDTLAGYNVNAIVLQVPKSALAFGADAAANPVIGIWSTTSRPATQVLDTRGNRTQTGAYVQVSRLGSPLVNEVVVPVGAKDLFNASQPVNDGQFLAGVTDPEVPKLMQKIYKIPAPPAPRTDLVSVFLTGVDGLTSPKLNADKGVHAAPAEELRLNMSIPPAASPNRMGVLAKDNAGFPNGRRLTDDVVDIEIQALEGILQPTHPASVSTLGDGVNEADRPFEASFPYLALPYANLGAHMAAAQPVAAPAAVVSPSGGGVNGAWVVIAAAGGALVAAVAVLLAMRRRTA